MRQTVVALVSGRSLAEHDNPGEATLQVVTGEVVLEAGEDRAELSAGDHLVIPDVRHALAATTDAVVLLTTGLRTATD